MIRPALAWICWITAALGQAPRDPFAGLPPDPSRGIQTLQLRSPEVHADRTVTFRLLAPGAQSVELMQGTRENWLGPPRAMSVATNGVWSITIGPLSPNIYYYAFAVNGLRYIEQGSISTVEIRNANPSFTTPAMFLMAKSGSIGTNRARFTRCGGCLSIHPRVTETTRRRAILSCSFSTAWG